MYEKERGQNVNVTTHDVAEWAYRKGLWQPRPKDILRQLADDLADAWRVEYRTDRLGRRYRAKHAVKPPRGSNQGVLWADMDSPSTLHSHMQQSLAQRRQGIVSDCLSLKTDADVYNDGRNPGEPIQPHLNFTMDVEELQLLNKRDPDEEVEAA